MSGFRWPRTFARSVLDSEMFNKNLRRWLSKLFERGGEQSFAFERLLFLTILRGKFTMIHKFNGIVCLQMFENVFIVGYILFFFFFNLSFTFYLVGGNILSLLSNVNPQNSSASVFTRVYTHERGYREQRILVVRNTKSQCIETDRLERSRRVSDNASNFLRPGRNFRVSGLAPVRFRVQAINSWVRSSSQKND